MFLLIRDILFTVMVLCIVAVFLSVIYLLKLWELFKDIHVKAKPETVRGSSARAGKRAGT